MHQKHSKSHVNTNSETHARREQSCSPWWRVSRLASCQWREAARWRSAPPSRAPSSAAHSAPAWTFSPRHLGRAAPAQVAAACAVARRGRSARRASERS
eukprot:6177768-Pleurochrysis_carterae.AAC.1